nr:uncharacterized protein LOC123280157 [Equus asinus]
MDNGEEQGPRAADSTRTRYRPIHTTLSEGRSAPPRPAPAARLFGPRPRARACASPERTAATDARSHCGKRVRRPRSQAACACVRARGALGRSQEIPGEERGGAPGALGGAASPRAPAAVGPQISAREHV